MTAEGYLRIAKGILLRNPQAELTIFNGKPVLQWREGRALWRFQVPEEIVPQLREFMASLEEEKDGKD